MPAAETAGRDSTAAEPARRNTTDHLVTVFSTHDPGLAAVAGSLLRSAGVRLSARGDALPYSGALPVDLQVPAGDADGARRVLEELSEPDARP